LDLWVIRENNTILGIVDSELQANQSIYLLINEIGYKEDDIQIETYGLNEVFG